jgi:glutamyl-tRNA synthetase
LPELIDKAQFVLLSRPVVPEPQAQASLDPAGRELLRTLTPHLRNAQWSKEGLEPVLSAVALAAGIGFGKLAAPLRAALAGRTVTPGVYDMMLVIGRDETIARLEDAGG